MNLKDGVGAVPGRTVMGVMGVEEGSKHINRGAPVLMVRVEESYDHF